MKCYFCQTTITQTNGFYGFECRACPVSVLHGVDTAGDKLLSVEMKTFLHNKHYNIYFVLDDWRHPQGRCVISEVKMFAEIGRGNYTLPRRKIILELSFLPPINPNNLKEKLSTYLTFL